MKSILRFISENCLFASGARVLHLGLALAPLVLSLVSSCMPTPPTGAASVHVTVYGFSIIKEPLEKSIYPAFSAKWKQEHGQEISFTSSFAGSETITNQILQGVGAEVAILAIERDVERLRQGGAVTSDWRAWPERGIINNSPLVILVRAGNPKGIRDFPDLAKRGVKVIHPDPVSSGSAQWSVLAIYGSELVKSEEQSGVPDPAHALRTLKAIWRNVISTPGSAREARTQFETGFGDALITYELEGLLMKDAKAAIEIIQPEATLFSEHPVVVVDRNVSAWKRPLVYAFVRYLWSEEAQRAFVKYHFRSVTDEALNKAHKEFVSIKMPFTVALFGGWDRAYPDVIERIWRDQVQRH